MTTIQFERTGGLMGRTQSITVDLDSIPLEQAETMRELLNQADFFSLEDADNPPPPDAFQYTITVNTKTVAHTIHVNDTTDNENLHALIAALNARLRSR